MGDVPRAMDKSESRKSSLLLRGSWLMPSSSGDGAKRLDFCWSPNGASHAGGYLLAIVHLVNVKTVRGQAKHKFQAQFTRVKWTPDICSRAREDSSFGVVQDSRLVN